MNIFFYLLFFFYQLNAFLDILLISQLAFTFDGGGYTTSKRSNIEHRKLVCVIMPLVLVDVSGDVREVCVQRPRSRCGTYKASLFRLNTTIAAIIVDRRVVRVEGPAMLRR